MSRISPEPGAAGWDGRAAGVAGIDADADLASCGALLRAGSRSFYAASFFLPRRIRRQATALYAFCRVADDAIDLSEDRGTALEALRHRLDRAYAACPLPHCADRAFAAVAAQSGMPRALPEALLEGFAWDAENRRYESLEDLTGYAARVAGAVGAMMSILMGVRDREALARACDLGVAMQFSNIARDVGEDARAGRLYLPLAWLREAGIDPDGWLAAPRFTPELARVVARLVSHADGLYRRAGQGIAVLPRSCRPGINTARLLYAEIGHEVVRRACDSVTMRAKVSAPRKALVLVRALAGSTRKPPFESVDVLDACRFLVEAVPHSGSAQTLSGRSDTEGSDGPRWWHVRERLVGVIGLFERLERLERAERLGPLRGSS